MATNELLDAEFPDSPNIDPNDLLGLFVQSATGTSVTYALHGNGKPVDGWPVKTGALAGDLLPLVFPGEDAAAGDLVAGRKGDEVALFAGTGFMRLVAGDGQVIRGFASEPPPGAKVTDTTPAAQPGRLPLDRAPERRSGPVGDQGRNRRSRARPTCWRSTRTSPSTTPCRPGTPRAATTAPASPWPPTTSSSCPSP